jgi:hypothetical protein
MGYKPSYNPQRKGDTVKIEIRDGSERILYKNKFSVNNEKEIYNFLKVIEKFSNLSISSIINNKLGLDWV